MPKRSKLSEEQWAKVIAYYTEGHTLTECQALSGASRWTISYQFKKRGVRVRDQLEPSRPEKAARVRSPQVKAKYVTPQEPTAPEGFITSPKRRIISLSGNGGEGKLVYEKEVTGGYNGNRPGNR